MALGNYKGETGTYDIYHFPTSQENLNLKFINKTTLSYTYGGSTYTLENIDGMRFKMINSASLLEKKIPASFTAILNSIMTIDITDDNFFVYETKTVIMPIANIMANDIDVKSGGLNPLTLNNISNVTFGTAVINGSNIEYTNTDGNIGDIATITYEAENFDGDITTGTINITIQAIPPIICNPDTFDLQQGETLLLSKAALSDNDVDGFEKYPLVVQTVINPINGSVSLNGDNVSFTSTGISGFPAEFEYTVTNTDGTVGTGKVYINVTPLPPIEALIYASDVGVQDAIANGYTPPTVADIFNTWARYDGAAYYDDKDSASGQALDWEYLTDPERVLMPTNTSKGNGFISPDKLDNYTFEATVTSDSTDDDGIGIIAAFTRDNGKNEVLFLNRTQGGVAPSNGFGFIYGDEGAVSTWVINNISVGGVNKNGTSGDENGWNSRKSRLKIQRQGDILTAYATEWNDVDNYQVSSKITLDLNSDSRLAVFKGKQSYGYYTHSQPNSTYLDVEFTGGLDATKLYDIEGNVLWKYIDGTWTNTGTTIQEDLGYVRDCTNPETGITYIIKGDEVIVKP
jgi:hypothetical protein